MANPARGVPHAVVDRGQTLRSIEGPVDERRVGAEVDVLHEVPVSDHMEEPRTDDARQQHRE